MANAVHDLHQLPPNLRTLSIVECPKLNFHPELRFPSSIKSLSVAASNDPTLRSVQALPHLSRLVIFGFREQKCLSCLQNLTCLQEFAIGKSSNVKRLLPKLENLQKTLEELKIIGCDDLDCITEEGWRNLSSLQTPRFQGCSGLTSLGDSLGCLKSLTKLDLVNCPSLVLSTNDFQHLALKHLTLENLPQLTSLPDGIQHLMALSHLYIMKCNNLRMLPQWLLEQHQMSSLFHLQIRGCHHELHEKCEVDKGEYWNKISHLWVDNSE